MSDVEKVVSYANMLGSATPIQLRWEASGDSIHAANLLKELKGRKYKDTNDPIKYHATINLYEDDKSTIYTTAVSNLSAAQEGCTSDQSYSISTGVDITRKSQSLGQNKAHIMFVRNLMPTDGSGSSLTQAENSLLVLHHNAIRSRSGSISENGQLKLGMSGQPGLSKSILVADRDKTKAKDLFLGASSLAKSASDSGSFITPGLLSDKGGSDYDDGEVMKNNGMSLGVKRTYYMTFQF